MKELKITRYILRVTLVLYILTAMWIIMMAVSYVMFSGFGSQEYRLVSDLFVLVTIGMVIIWPLIYKHKKRRAEALINNKDYLGASKALRVPMYAFYLAVVIYFVMLLLLTTFTL